MTKVKAGKHGRMGAAEFRTAIAALGLSQMGCARFFAVNGATVQRWARGEQDVPRAVEYTLRLLVQEQIDPESLV